MHVFVSTSNCNMTICRPTNTLDLCSRRRCIWMRWSSIITLWSSLSINLSIASLPSKSFPAKSLMTRSFPTSWNPMAWEEHDDEWQWSHQCQRRETSCRSYDWDSSSSPNWGLWWMFCPASFWTPLSISQLFWVKFDDADFHHRQPKASTMWSCMTNAAKARTLMRYAVCGLVNT